MLGALALVAAMAGCAQAPKKQAFNREVSGHIETVVVTQSPNQDSYAASAAVERAYSAVVVNTMSAGVAFFNVYSGKDGRSILRSAPAGELALEVIGLAAPAK